MDDAKFATPLLKLPTTKMEPNENVPNSRQGSRQGKRRIVIERLPTDKERNATFLNRRARLLKKARELATLCGVDVTLIVFSPQGELYEFSSNTNAHILHQYLVKKQEHEGHTIDPKLVALYYMLAHVEALEHEANRNKYNSELHRIMIDPRLRKFTVDELQIMRERNLLNKFKETLQNNQLAIREFNEKRRKVGVWDTLTSKGKVEGDFLVHPGDFVHNYEPPRVPRETYNHHRTLTIYVNEAATPLTMDEQQDPQWAIGAAPGPPGFIANQGQYREFQHQVHTRHHEAYNMPQQSVMQQARESELLQATMERERELLNVQNYREVMLSHPDQAQEDDHLGEQDINDMLKFLLE